MITRFIELYIALSTVSLNLLQIYGTSTASYGKKVSSTYQNCQGGQWFYAESSSHCELAAKGYTRMYILWRVSALFSASSLYLYRLFSKGLRKGL